MTEPLHALFAPEQRVKRAREHIAALGVHLQEWTTLPVAELGWASVLIGDALFNLRAALDYLVYVLAVVNNNGRHVSGTQFPIEGSMEM